MMVKRSPLILGILVLLLAGATAALGVSEEAFQLNEEGIALMDRGKFEQAKEKFLAAVEADGEYWDARVNAARAAEKLEDWVTLKTQYLTVLEYDEENYDALVGIGHYEVATSNFADAEKHFRKALEIEPRSASVRYGLGNLYHKMKKPTNAKAEYEKLIGLDPRGYPRAYLRLGLYEFDGAKQTKKYDAAAAHLEKYLTLDDDPEGVGLAHYRLALIYYQQNKNEKALAHFTEAKKADPSDYRSYYYSAEIHRKAGNRAAAEKEYLDAVKRKPDLGEAHFQLAIMYQQDYRDEDALNHYKQAAADRTFKQRSQAQAQVAALEEYFRKLREAEAANQ
ncbi:MAG: tetratricopeptide repeat protein [Candidatus Eisenbacteria bacterium]